MLQYERFQEIIFEESGKSAEDWKHILPAIPIAHRYRFLQTLKKGFSIPASFDMVMLSQAIGDKEYSLFVQQALATKIAGEVEEGRGIEKFSVDD